MTANNGKLQGKAVTLFDGVFFVAVKAPAFIADPFARTNGTRKNVDIINTRIGCARWF